uniref:Uncharacterized protein n=1 Tax=Amphimedon queenslandica TaxID=400682 RepID=A0A1X7SQ77_AMPQE
NFSLRGHRDNVTDLERNVAGSHNHGNFWALINFRIDSGDAVLEEHLINASRHATYTSSVIQNQVIEILTDQVR